MLIGSACRWPFLAIAHDPDLLRRNTHRNHRLPHRVSAALSQGDVVLTAATLIGMPFQLRDRPRTLGQFAGVRLNNRLAFRQNFRAIEAEVNNAVSGNRVAGNRLTGPFTAARRCAAAGVIGFVTTGRGLTITVTVSLLARLCSDPRLRRSVLGGLLFLGGAFAGCRATGQQRQRSGGNEGADHDVHAIFPSTR